MSDTRIRVHVMCPSDRPHFQGQWVCPQSGARRTRSLKTADEAEARTRAADLEYRLNHGLSAGRPGRPDGVSWAEFRKRHDAERVPLLRPITGQFLSSLFDIVEDALSPTRLSDVASEGGLARLLSAFRARPSRRSARSPFSDAGNLAHVRAALSWAVKRKPPLLAALPPFPAVKLPRARPIPPQDGDVQRLLDAAPPQWRAFLLSGLLAGLRLGEAFELRRDASEEFPWLDLERGRIWIPHAFAKGHSDDWVPLHADLREALLSLPHAGPHVFRLPSHTGTVPRSGVAAWITALARRANARASMQAMRRAFLSGLASRVPAAVLQRLARHKDIATTMRHYAMADDDSLRRAVEGLRGNESHNATEDGRRKPNACKD